jgi:deoxyribose-phosphate aldolase
MSAQAEPRLSYQDIAGMMEHPVLRPELSEEAVTVRPSDADLAVEWMKGSGVAVGSVVGYPHGCSTTSAKLYETRDLLRRGITEIDTVINLGKLISRQFQYVEMELEQMATACHEGGAILKVAFENGYLTEDLKTIACKIVKRAGAHYARTSTPFGPLPCSLADVALMKRLLGDRAKIKASGGVRTISDVLELREAGCARIGTIATVAILEDWKAQLKTTT